MSLPPPLPSASPPVLQYATPAHLTPSQGVWRDGNSVVLVKGAALPPRCVKCNQPADDRYRWTKTVYWHPPVLYVLIIPGILIYAIVASIVQKKARVTAGLCTKHGKQRRTRALIGWLTAFVGLCCISVSAVIDSRRGYDTLCITLGILLMLAALIWAFVATRVLWPTNIDNHFAHLNGACPEYLDSLQGIVR